MQQDEEEGSLEESSKADRDTISDQAIDTKYDSWQTLKRIWGTVSPSLDNEIMWKCLYFCYLFPKAYNFYKEDIIHIWLAQGFFPVSEMIEYCISLYFNEFEKLQIFLLSGLDCSTRRLRYRLNNSIVNLLVECHSDEYSRVDDAVSYVSRNTLHYSCGDGSIDPITLQDLYRAKKLSTLLILHQSGSCFDKIPRELFLNLPFLRVLDLSYTHIVALPSSIAKLKDLRYLNLSGTPMTMLPSSMCTLCKLQVLKLRGCLKLVSLPRDLRKLKCLRHLDLDLSCLLVSMPSGIGNLTELRSLPAFVVGKHDGFHINEMKFMNNLGGTLRIMRLENVANLEEAKEASLDQKLNVRKIELHWTEVIDGNGLLENLKPHKSASELQITGYGGVKFPCWIGQPLFSQLLSITIHDCKKCELLPPLGKLPLLSDLYISDMHEVKDIDQRLCSRNSNVESLDNDKSCEANMFKAFPSLVKFTLSGMPKLEKWSGIEEGDFPRLKKLSISDCGILIAPPKLSLLKSLRQLEISLYPSLSNFPTEGLPGSLGVIVIIDCPLLKEWCHKDGVQASGMLERVPNVWIDHHQILRASIAGVLVKGLEGCKTLNKDPDPNNPLEGIENRR